VVNVDRIGERPLDHVMMGFHLLRLVTVFVGVVERRIANAANKTWQIALDRQMMMGRLIKGRLGPLVMHRIELQLVDRAALDVLSTDLSGRHDIFLRNAA
jgi:hypothetical protein